MLLALCEKADELQSSNLSEALKVSLKALSALNKQPIELIVFYMCFETATRCLDYFGNVISCEEF